MDDLISRQAAIDALKQYRAFYCDNTPDVFSKLSYAEKCRVNELDMAIATLINLPSVQPEKVCIANITLSKEQVLEAVEKAKSEIIQLLPSKQSERKKGKWIKNDNGTYYCNLCHSWIPNEQRHYANYCLFCGVDMREETDNAEDIH